jgi:hypothetical protein
MGWYVLLSAAVSATLGTAAYGIARWTFVDPPVLISMGFFGCTKGTIRLQFERLVSPVAAWHLSFRPYADLSLRP